MAAATVRVGVQLELLDDPRASAREVREARRRLLEEVDGLWRTAQLRSTQVQPLDEVRSVMSVFDDSLFRVVPEVYRDLDVALSPDDAGLRPPLASVGMASAAGLPPPTSRSCATRTSSGRCSTLCSTTPR